MNKNDLLSFLNTIGATDVAAELSKDSAMGWLTLLLQFLPIILEWLKKLLQQEREAAKRGIDSPIMAAIKVFETTGDSKPFIAASEAAMAQERRLAEVK